MDVFPNHASSQPAAASWRVEPVTPSQAGRALALIVGAGRGGPDITAGVAALQGYLTGEMSTSYELWWAREHDRPLASALAVHSPGRTAVVLFSTTDTGLISVEPLRDVLKAMSNQTLHSEATLVQALLSPASRSDVQAFEAAGFFRLAELIYMRQCLRGRTAQQAETAEPLSYLHYSEQTHEAFASTIQASYADSLDCPALDGLRDIEDVLAGHKAAGIFRPDLWTLAFCDGRPAGIVLMNQNATQNVAEIIYMGVARPFRGRGIGRALMIKATEMAIGDRFGAISLAVDAENTHALQIYDAEGFTEASRRLAFVRTKQAHR